MTIGIPRALIYWKKPYFWEHFFESLGFKVLLSPKTNKEIVEVGVRNSDPEDCFSKKVYFGHLIWLDGKCDLIFLPRLKTNSQGLEYCPKFFGLPDLGKLLVRTPLLIENFDERKDSFEKIVLRLGRKLKIPRKEKIKKALLEASLRERERKILQKEGFFQKINSPKPKILLVSHPYILYDEYVNLGIVSKLRRLNTEVILIEEVFLEDAQKELDIRFHWEFGEEIMRKISQILKHKISGAVEISSFACGCDAVLKEFVEKKIKEQKIPFLYIIIDEHTGEAGFQTRLEAFIDTL